MTYGAEVWGPPVIAAAANFLGSKFGGTDETKMQKTQRKLVDQLLSSLGGDGPFADLYKTDESAFQKSFVDPAKSLFNNQIAPQIQQQFIASGQQGGTGLDDTLTRAGVDLDNLLNQHMYQFQQDALNRKQGTLNSILGGAAGAASQRSPTESAVSGLSGYLSGPNFADQFQQYFKPKPADNNPMPERKGFSE